MDEPLNNFSQMPEGEPPGSPAAHERRYAARRLWRRLMMLLVAGGAAFGLTTWILVRLDNPVGPLGLKSSPAAVVRAHLEALNRGELRAAYELFSRRYRQQVPFDAYRELVVTHRRMFRTRELRFSRHEESGERAVLETHMRAEGGERYVARFTLIRAEGRWWINDLRWGAESDHSELVAV
jgi:hypothetical protein